METTGQKILVLGAAGKMGTAVRSVFFDGYTIEARSSHDFDAGDLDSVRWTVAQAKPDIVINCVAFLGIDPCEKDPVRAEQLNALYPKCLAELSNEQDFLLAHFSTDAVFDDSKNDFYNESDKPHPVNLYGKTKLQGDRYIEQIAKRYYIIRISVQFGEVAKQTQFVEKMLKRIEDGQKTLRIAGDIISSPSYSRDIARRLRTIIEDGEPFGLYHVANEGKASLYDLMKEVVRCLGLEVTIERGFSKDFPSVGAKNTNTPIRSEKIQGLRPWKDAVAEYCSNLKRKQQT